MPQRRQLKADLRELTPSRPLVVGGYSVFKVTDQPSWADFNGPNQPRINLSFHDALWAYDVMAPGKGRLLTHREWDLVSGVTEGILCATASGKPTKDQANLRNEVGRTTDVGSYPSFRGFYDLIGNVWEWVLPDQPNHNPGLRGWSWRLNPGVERDSVYRYGGHGGAHFRYDFIGARGVLVP